MADDPRGQVIRRLAVMLRSSTPTTRPARRMSRAVLAEAHAEIDASQGSSGRDDHAARRSAGAGIAWSWHGPSSPAIGLGVAIWGYFDANADLKALTRPTNGRLIIARGYDGPRASVSASSSCC